MAYRILECSLFIIHQNIVAPIEAFACMKSSRSWVASYNETHIRIRHMLIDTVLVTINMYLKS